MKDDSLTSLTEEQKRQYLRETRPMRFFADSNGDVMVTMTMTDVHLLILLVGAGLGSLANEGPLETVFQRFDERFQVAIAT